MEEKLNQPLPGQPVPEPQVQPVQEVKPTKAWGISALVTAIFSILLCLAPYFGLPLALFSYYATGKQKSIGLSGHETLANVLATIGLILNLITGMMVLVYLAFVM